jgi:hypothetical protein
MDESAELDEQLRGIAPPPPVRPLAPERLTLRKEIVMREVVRSFDSDASTPLRDPARRRGLPARRRVRRPVLVAVAVLLLGGTAVGWAFVASSARNTVSVECEIGGSDTIIPSATGDPVADCAAQWQRDKGSPAPPLVAYDNSVGGITVLPASQTPPSGFTRLPSGATQNVSMVEMQQWLDDYVSGLNSGCYDNAAAVKMTRQALARFGMADWTVHPAPASDTAPCVDTGILDAGTRTVALRALGGPVPSDFPPEKLAVRLRAIAQGCASLDATAKLVRSAARELGLSEHAHDYELTEVRNDSARCTTIYENVGGTIFLILRGPSD